MWRSCGRNVLRPYGGGSVRGRRGVWEGRSTLRPYGGRVGGGVGVSEAQRGAPQRLMVIVAFPWALLGKADGG